MVYRLIGRTSSREVSIDIDVDRVFEVGQRVALSLADPSEFEEVRITKLADVAWDDGYIVAAIQPLEPPTYEQGTEGEYPRQDG
jgi:hypothetical protein